VSVAGQLRNLDRQLVRVEQVVGVEKLNELARRLSETAVSSAGAASPLLMHVLELRSETMLISSTVHHGAEVFFRPIVNDDDFKVPVCLERTRGKGLAQQTPAVVTRNDHRN